MKKQLEALFDVGEQLAERYENEELLRGREGFSLPNRSIIIKILKESRKIMFPGYFFDEGMSMGDVKSNPEYRLHHVGGMLYEQILTAVSYADKEKCSAEKANQLTHEVIMQFPHIQEMLLKDVEAGFDGDPAAQTRENVIISYPGLYAIFVYRLAHELYIRDIPYIPRIMTEFAHSRTGIDINAGAKIGEYFFIDHGTGVVIGETTEIGDHVKIYQGVTLGALSLRKGQGLAGVKRHPTIEDNVTIYANSTILGGDTVIGHDSVISGNTFIVQTIPAGTKASTDLPQIRYASQYDVPYYGDNI
ncbi:MAG: serine O-acetyltransferase [Eubacterium sp.]|nr:serine O-acetyltransferase [Eubacterium sp.]